MYFSGVDTTVKQIKAGVTEDLDIVELSYSSDQGASPLFSYAMVEYVTAMNASCIVQGVFALNLTENKYEWKLPRIFIITRSKKEFVKDSSSVYKTEKKEVETLLRNVNIISHSVKIHPDSGNLVEIFHFLAESIE